MSVSISRDEWMKALAEAGFSDEHDESALTIHEFAQMFGVTPSTAQYRLAGLVAKGKAVATLKWGRTPYGRRIQYKAYRLVDTPAKKRRSA